MTATLTGRPVSEAERSLALLADAQLLETPASGHYRLHGLLRLFARELAEAHMDAADSQAAPSTV